jgi:hypothetical protein
MRRERERETLTLHPHPTPYTLTQHPHPTPYTLTLHPHPNPCPNPYPDPRYLRPMVGSIFSLAPDTETGFDITFKIDANDLFTKSEEEK